MADLTTLLADFLGSLVAGVPKVRVGVGATAANVLGLLNQSTASVSNVGVAETDLMTYSLPLSTLSADGKGVRVTAWGTCAATANTKTVKIYFGATAVSTLASALNNGSWEAVMEVYRTGAATQIAKGRIEFYNSAGQITATAHLTASPTETLSGALTIKVTGQSNAAGTDVTQLQMAVSAIP